MNKKKIIAILAVAFAISATSISPVNEMDDIVKYDCDYKTHLKTTARLNRYITSVLSEEKIEYETYWTTTSVNVRTMPSTESTIINVFPQNYKMQVNRINDEWVSTYYKGKVCYVNANYIQDHEVDYKIFDVPYAANKTWMPYTAITSKSSPQYKLQHSKAYTGNYGIRMVNNRYCVALGSYFGCKIGDEFDLILENGTVIPCVMADEKDDLHTDSSNIITIETDCLSEFVVDKSNLHKTAKKMGNISYVCEEWNSPVVQIKTYKKE